MTINQYINQKQHGQQNCACKYRISDIKNLQVNSETDQQTLKNKFKKETPTWEMGPEVFIVANADKKT